MFNEWLTLRVKLSVILWFRLNKEFSVYVRICRYFNSGSKQWMEPGLHGWFYYGLIPFVCLLQRLVQEEFWIFRFCLVFRMIFWKISAVQNLVQYKFGKWQKENIKEILLWYNSLECVINTLLWRFGNLFVIYANYMFRDKTGTRFAKKEKNVADVSP